MFVRKKRELNVDEIDERKELRRGKTSIADIISFLTSRLSLNPLGKNSQNFLWQNCNFFRYFYEGNIHVKMGKL